MGSIPTRYMTSTKKAVKKKRKESLYLTGDRCRRVFEKVFTWGWDAVV